MEDFVIFLKILFLGKTILLTPSPIDLSNQWLELTPNITIEAVTGGASLQVRFSRQHRLFIEAKDLGEVFEIAEKVLPDRAIKAELEDKQGNKIILSRRTIGVSKDYVIYGVVDDAPMPTDIEFKTIRIMSNIDLKDVKIYWKNFKH